MIEKDYIMRLLQNLSRAIARIIRAQNVDDAGLVEKEVAKAYQGLMGTGPEIWHAMDSKTILAIVQDDPKLKGLALLFTEEARWAIQAGAGEKALPLLAKASDLLDELSRRSKVEDDDLLKYRKKVAHLLKSMGDGG